MAAPRRLSAAVLSRPWLRHSWAPHHLAVDPTFAATGPLTVKRSESRFFMYEEHRSGKLEDSDGNIGGATELLQQSPAEFFGAVAAAAGNATAETGGGGSKRYQYWTSPLADCASELLARLPGFEQLHELLPLELSDRTAAAAAVSAEGSSSGQTRQARSELPTDQRGPSLWVGSAGSSTQAHYDVADNVIVQLHGSKRLRCYPPHAATCLHVFPDAHPRARKSQVNFDAPDHGRFPLFAALPPPALDVTLQPGDALSVPAFWFHHVENDPDGPSVSLNLFAPSPACVLSPPAYVPSAISSAGYAAAHCVRVCLCVCSRFRLMAAQPIFAHRVPAVSTGTAAGGATSGVALAMLRHMGTGLLDGLRASQPLLPAPDVFGRQLVASRYTPLLNCGSALVTEPEAAVDATAVAEADEVLYSVLHYFEQLRSSVVAGCSDQDDASEAHEYADAVVEIVVAHLLELWAVQLVGADEVGPALVSCFSARGGG